MNATRILHLIATHVHSGPAPATLRLAAAQRDAGHDVAILRDTHRRPDELAAPLAARALHDLDGPPLTPRAAPHVHLRALLALPRAIARFAPDVLHCHTSHDHTLAALTRRRHGVPIVRTVHTERALDPTPPRTWLLRTAAHLLVRCPAHAARLDARGIPASRCTVVPASIDAATFTSGDGHSLRRAWSVPPGAVLVGTVARFNAGRRHEHLVESFAAAARIEPGLHLVLAGRGEREPTIRALVTARGLDARTTFAGFHPLALVELLHALDVFVLLREGNDVAVPALLEAMAAARATVGTDRPVIAETLAGGAGVVVPERDAHALATTLVDLARDAPRRAALGRAARDRVLTRHHVDAERAGTDAAYACTVARA